MDLSSSTAAARPRSTLAPPSGGSGGGGGGGGCSIHSRVTTQTREPTSSLDIVWVCLEVVSEVAEGGQKWPEMAGGVG